jgi:pimeloyl-ACP methyl ester carboxylesterase
MLGLASMSGTVSQWTEVNGLRVHSHRATPPFGGPPVVLVHGLGVSSRYLLPTARALATRFDVYAIDLPGSGRSERPTHPLTFAEAAETLLRWLDAIHLERPSFLGNSMGCQVLLELAVAAPQRVDRLVLAGPTVDPRWRSLASQVPRWLLELFREPLSLLPILLRDYWTFGPMRFFETGRFALSDRPEDKMPHVRAPTLVVRGERDAFVSDAWVQRCAQLLPVAATATVRGAAHAVNYSAPEALARVVAPFLESTATTGRQPRTGLAAPAGGRGRARAISAASSNR